MKDQSLRGFDLYEARLRWRKAEDRPVSRESEKPQMDVQIGEEVDVRSVRDCQPVQSLTGSLHDKLHFYKPKESHWDAQCSRSLAKKPMATLSEPRYRCISFMHSAGIRRVLWTNTKGEWEGDRVQKLVDDLGDSNSSAGNERGGGQ